MKCKRGLITTYASDGTPVQYFQPEVWITRAQTASYMTRTFKYIEKILRGIKMSKRWLDVGPKDWFYRAVLETDNIFIDAKRRNLI